MGPVEPTFKDLIAILGGWTVIFVAAIAWATKHLSNTLYQNGGASYLQVLTSETNNFAAELNLAQAQLNERLALVQIYNALGGGWQQ